MHAWAITLRAYDKLCKLFSLPVCSRQPRSGNKKVSLKAAAETETKAHIPGAEQNPHFCFRDSIRTQNNTPDPRY